MGKEKIKLIVSQADVSEEIKKIAKKIIAEIRIDEQEGILLYEQGELAFLGALANFVREKKNAKNVYYNQNFHIEPTNVCINHCKFCSYRRNLGEDGCWELTIGEIADIVRSTNLEATEVHIVGGAHPNRDLNYYLNLLAEIKFVRPNIHIKAFTAVEIDYMAKKAGVSILDAIEKLKNVGLGSIPGGGAEIFDEKIRAEICPDKTSSQDWLMIHKTVHSLGLNSNATMLYGHIEDYAHRIDHMSRLRKLQDQTNGFQAFIPLKFRNDKNNLSHLKELTTIEDLKNYAVSRIFLDNIPHIKAYWPMIGKQTAKLSLSFGVDDLDGTIDDSTRIYSMAGAEDKSPTMTVEKLSEIIKSAGFIPIERDSLYKQFN